jgi:hypothetical protein
VSIKLYRRETREGERDEVERRRSSISVKGRTRQELIIGPIGMNSVSLLL